MQLFTILPLFGVHDNKYIKSLDLSELQLDVFQGRHESNWSCKISGLSLASILARCGAGSHMGTDSSHEFQFRGVKGIPSSPAAPGWEVTAVRSKGPTALPAGQELGQCKSGFFSPCFFYFMAQGTCVGSPRNQSVFGSSWRLHILPFFEPSLSLGTKKVESLSSRLVQIELENMDLTVSVEIIS